MKEAQFFLVSSMLDKHFQMHVECLKTFSRCVKIDQSSSYFNLPTLLIPFLLLLFLFSTLKGLEGFDRSVLRRAGLVMFQRFCLMPALALAMVEAGKRTGLLLPTGDPLLIFILLLQACMPSAQNSVLILQLEKRPHAAASMARLISTVYVLSILPIGLLIRALLSYCPLGF